METQKPVSLAIVGPFSSGKSTLLNALVGETVQSMGVLPETSMLSHLTWGATRAGRIHMADGRIVEGTFEETRARITELEQSGGVGAVNHLEHSLPQNFLQHLHLWDTPGLNSTYLHHDIVAERAIRTADIILWVTPIDAAVTREEVEKIAKRKPATTPMLVVVNKTDLAEPNELADAIAAIRLDLAGVATSVHPTTALSAYERASGHDTSFVGDDGIADLRRSIAEHVASVHAMRARTAQETPRVRLKPSEFECPNCSEICESTDLFCVCGRDLSDQLRECARCGSKNVLRRDRCRNCNVVFATAEESDELERLALEDLAQLNLSAASAKLTLSTQLDPAVAGRHDLAKSIERSAEALQDLVVAAAFAVKGSPAMWLDETLRAEKLISVSDIQSALGSCATGAAFTTEGQRRRRDLFADWRCTRSPFEVVLLGVKAALEDCLTEAWHLSATMEPAAVEKANAIIQELSVERAVREAERRMDSASNGPRAEARAAVMEVLQGGVRIRLACESVVEQEFEAALDHLRSAAFSKRLRDKVPDLEQRCHDLCGHRDFRDAQVVETVDRFLCEGGAAVAGGDLDKALGLIEQADEAILSASPRHREATVARIRGLEKRVRSAESQGQGLIRDAEGCDGREQFEVALDLLKRAAGVDRRLQPRADRGEEELPSKVDARDRLNRIEENVESGRLLQAEEGLAELDAGWKLNDSMHLQVACRRATSLRSRVGKSRIKAKGLLESGNQKAGEGKRMEAVVDLMCARAIDSGLLKQSTKSESSILWRLRSDRADYVVAVFFAVVARAAVIGAVIGSLMAASYVIAFVLARVAEPVLGGGYTIPVLAGVYVVIKILVTIWRVAWPPSAPPSPQEFMEAASRKAIETLEKWGRTGSAQVLRAEADGRVGR
ncbi:MAG: dynamin family protein [Dehalococcoidia bacterium]